MTEISTNPDMKPVKIGYVGCGFIAQNIHLPNFASIPECDLVALAELRPELGKIVADKYQIPKLVVSHRDLCDDPEIEAVAVSANYVVQGEIAADLLAAGKHVFMEKPMAVSVGQANKILKAADDGGARIMVGYMKRYDPANMLMRDTVREWRKHGEKGRLIYLRAHGYCGNWTAGRTKSVITTSEQMPPLPVNDCAPNWLPSDKVEKYIGYLQQYTHNINLARFILDAPNQELSVRSVDLDDDGLTGVVLLDLGGVRVAVESANTRYHAWEEHTQVYFEGGWVHAHSPVLFADPGQPKIEIYESGETPQFKYPVAEPMAAWHFREEAIDFLKSLRSGNSFRSPGLDALHDVRVLEEIYRTYLNL